MTYTPSDLPEFTNIHTLAPRLFLSSFLTLHLQTLTNMIVIAPSWVDDPEDDEPPPFTLKGGQHSIVDMHQAAFVEYNRVADCKWRTFNPHEELVVSESLVHA